MAETLFNVAVWIAVAALAIAFIRMILGPTIPDRIAALDTMTIISLSIIMFIAWLTGRVIYLDVALVYAFVSFLGVLASARYLERGL